MSKEHSKNVVIDEVKYSKRSRKIKWTDREYHIEDNADVSNKDVKLYCDTNQFPTLPFCGSYSNHRVPRVLSKNYHLFFDPKFGHGICAIFRISCACVAR